MVEPSVSRMGINPESETTTLSQSSVIFFPVADAVLLFILSDYASRVQQEWSWKRTREAVFIYLVIAQGNLSHIFVPYGCLIEITVDTANPGRDR